MKLILLLEYGIPHYRRFIFDWLRDKSSHFKIIHSGERFSFDYDYQAKKGLNLKLFKGISICIFNIFIIRNYDVVVSTLNYRKPHTWIPWFFYRDKKWIFWGQGSGNSKSKLVIKIKKYIINNSDGYIVYTPAGKKELEDIGVNSSKISIAYNTLKIDNFELTMGSDYLLFVGRIQKRKGLERVLKAIQNTAYKFVIVGKGGDYELELKNMALKMNLANQVIFKGEVYDDEELKDIFSGAASYISPDHLGLGVVHAFAYGVPVIVNRNKNHAPEFLYCTNNNSYIYDNDIELPLIIDEVFNDGEKRIMKKEKAFKYYKDNLDYKNVLIAFDYQLKRT